MWPGKQTDARGTCIHYLSTERPMSRAFTNQDSGAVVAAEAERPGTCQPVHADTPTSTDGTERPQSPNVPTSMIACLKPMDRSRAEC